MAKDINSRLPDGDEGKANRSQNLQSLNKLSPEEEKVLKDLSSEAYWKRAMPLSAGAMVGALGLFRAGYLKPHPKFGQIPKMAGIGFLGYVFGKMSYIPTMQEEILKRIPNSNLAAQIRKNRGMPNQEEEQTAAHWEPPSRVPPARHNDGMDDGFRPSADTEENPEGGEQRTITYDDLRRRHREQQQQKQQQPQQQPSYKDSPWMPQQPFPPPNPDMFAEPNKEPEAYPRPPPAAQDPSSKKKRTNIWGDPIDD